MSSLTSLVQFLLVFPAICSATVTSELHHYNDLSSDYSHLRHKREVTLANRSFCSSDSNWPLIRVNTTDQLQKLRALMGSSSYGHLQAYIIPTDDEHQSEYVAPYDERRKFISGFSGSEGTAIVTLDKAAVWTDGRYFLQADEELDCNWILMKSGLPGVPTLMEWVKEELTSGNKIGSDPRLIGADTWITWKNSLDPAGIQLEEVEMNLIDKIWTKDRPPRSQNPAFVLDLKFAGKSWKDKVKEINVKLRELGADAMVVTAMDEVAWLFNLRGSDIPKSPVFRAYAVVSQEELQVKEASISR